GPALAGDGFAVFARGGAVCAAGVAVAAILRLHRYSGGAGADQCGGGAFVLSVEQKGCIVTGTPLAAIGLLLFANIFMTFAWYGHLKHKEAALWLVILASWGIAFFEYCLQVPANR